MNYAGERKQLPGRVGDSLLNVAQRYKYEFVDGASSPRPPPLASPRGAPATHPPATRARSRAYARVRSLSRPSFPLAGACGGGGTPVDVLHAEGGWYEPKYGEGAQCHFCHVIIPKSHYALLPPKRPDELERLQEYPFPEDMTDTCVFGRTGDGDTAPPELCVIASPAHNASYPSHPPYQTPRPQLAPRVPGPQH